jgi:hypothetical protein
VHEDVRTELDAVVQATQSRITAFREEAERGRARLEEGLDDERSQRVDGEEEVKRKLDTFMRLYEVERVRLRDATRSALEQMTERTRAVQEVSKSMQQEGVRIKLAAARVEEQAMGGLKSLTEKVEDGFHVLRAVQDRHALQIQENRQAGSTAVQDLRDKLQEGQQRVQAELDKNFQEDRQMRQDLNKRIDDCEEGAQKAERRLTHSHQELEDSVRHTLESMGKDMETLRFRTTTSLSDVEGQTHELKQRVHSVEVLSEKRFAGHADDIRSAHAKMWDEILHLKSNARGTAAVDQSLRVANNMHLQKLAAVVKRLGGTLLAFERGARVAQPVEELAKETARIELDLVSDAKDIENIPTRVKALGHGEAEREAARLKTHDAGIQVADMTLSVDLSGTDKTASLHKSVSLEIMSGSLERGGGGEGGGGSGSVKKNGIPKSSNAEEGTRAGSASLSSFGEVEEFAQKFVDERIASALYKIPDASDVAVGAHEEGTGGPGGLGGPGGGSARAEDVDGEEEEGGVTEEAFEEDFGEEAADEVQALAHEHGMSGLRAEEEEEAAVRRPGVGAQGALSDAGLDGAHASEEDEIPEFENSIGSKSAELSLRGEGYHSYYHCFYIMLFY